MSKKALAAYDANVRIMGERLKADAVERLIADWNHDYDQTKTLLILAHLRRDVRTMNIMAREKLVERGIVGEVTRSKRLTASASSTWEIRSSS